MIKIAGRTTQQWAYWLRKNVSPFREERLFGTFAILVRGLVQVARLILAAPSRGSVAKAALCLRVIPHHTMIAPDLLFKMIDLAHQVGQRGIEGDIVECGVWNGGSLALLACATGGARDAWAFDSFQGLPPPSPIDPPLVRDYFYEGWNIGSIDNVRRAWSLFHLPVERLHIVPGWFRDTFPRTQVDRIAVLHIDSDLHESVRACLDRWFDHIQPGGIVLINDYNLYAGANRAVDAFFASRARSHAIHPLAKVGAYVLKDDCG